MSSLKIRQEPVFVMKQQLPPITSHYYLSFEVCAVE